MPKTRIPTQKRSLEKYEKIIDAAFTLFNENGYFNTTTTDIAKKSGVAVGSIYSYFLDKKEIYIEIIKRINEKFKEPTHDYWVEKGTIINLDEEKIKSLFRIFIEMLMEYHNFSKMFHDDMQAFGLLDTDIAKLQKENEEERNRRTREVFEIIEIPFKEERDAEVFLHYCNLLMDDVCHSVLYQDESQNKDIYLEQTVDLLYRLLQNLTDIK